MTSDTKTTQRSLWWRDETVVIFALLLGCCFVSELVKQFRCCRAGRSIPGFLLQFTLEYKNWLWIATLTLMTWTPILALMSVFHLFNAGSYRRARVRLEKVTDESLELLNLSGEDKVVPLLSIKRVIQTSWPDYLSVVLNSRFYLWICLQFVEGEGTWVFTKDAQLFVIQPPLDTAAARDLGDRLIQLNGK